MKRFLLSSMTVLMVIALCAQDVTLRKISGLDIGGEGAAEISAYDELNARLWVLNAEAERIDMVSLIDPANPVVSGSFDYSSYGAAANSIDINAGRVVIAVENANKQMPGTLVVVDAITALPLGDFPAGALPDMVKFSHNGRWIMAANEGEPNDDFSVNPEGSVTLIDLQAGVANATVYQIGFTNLVTPEPSTGFKMTGPEGTTLARTLEPEYIAFSADDATALVVCQENNALVKIDVATARAHSIMPLGVKDHSLPGNGFDASDKSDNVNIVPHPVMGLYQPDAIYSFTVEGQTYYITANEGDAADYAGYSEETRVADLQLDPTAYPDAATLQQNENLGRLKTTTAMGDADGDGDVDQIYAYGARSFSIWNGDGVLVYDSGDDFEQRALTEIPDFFNCNYDDETGTFEYKKRSDDKGPEPEGVVTGRVGDKTYAFIGLERTSAILVYDVTNPVLPVFQQWVSTPDYVTGGEDISPEGILFIPALQSPSNKALVVASFEVSGSLAIYEVDQTTGIGEHEVELPMAHPNPSAGRFVFGLPVTGTVYNVHGKPVLRARNQSVLDLSDLPTGIYLFRNELGEAARLVVSR